MEDAIESIVKIHVENAYGSFITLTDPLLSHTSIEQMCKIVYKHVPNVCLSIEVILEYKGVTTRTRNLDQFIQQMVVYIIIYLSRVRDNHNSPMLHVCEQLYVMVRVV